MIKFDDIFPDFSFLMKNDFDLNECTYSPREFGDAVLIIKGVTYSFRFVRDRGQLFIDVGDDIVGWYRLEDVLEYVCKKPIELKFNSISSSNYLANLTKDKLKEITDIFKETEKINAVKIFVKVKHSP